MKQIIYSEALQRDPEWLEMAQRATQFLNEIAAKNSAELIAEWDRIDSDKGPGIELHLREPGAEASVQLLRRHFEPGGMYPGYIFRVWGRILRERVDRSMEKLLAISSVSEE